MNHLFLKEFIIYILYFIKKPSQPAVAFYLSRKLNVNSSNC